MASLRISLCLSLAAVLLLVTGGGCGSGATGPKCSDCSSLDGPCSEGRCNEDTGQCEIVARNEGEACDDGDACTSDDICQQGSCQGQPLQCTEQETECIKGECQRGECQYVPREDGTSCLSAADQCNQGVCVDGSCQSEPLADGTACNDGDWCTVQDTCTAGTCAGTARDCSDDRDCTDDSCDSSRNACDHQPRDGFCLIGGECFSDGAVNPANVCQACLAATAPTDWSDHDGAACDDGNRCTGEDTCSGGVCAGTAIAGCCLEDADCDDGLDCTSDSCRQADGTCDNQVNAGFCLIGSGCVTEGTLDPQNPCRECLPAVNSRDWSDNTRSCDDGLFCTVSDTCSGGTCQGVTGGLCDDGFDCTDDQCDEQAQACHHNTRAGFCLIANACFADGSVNPGNPCQLCSSAASQSDWSPNDGAACDDGNICTDNDTCSGGTCSGSPLPNCCNTDSQCDDNRDCTSDTCEVASGTCFNTVTAGHCLIGGACYNDGAVNPSNPCQACNAAANPNSWSPANDGGQCGGLCQWCQAGACTDIPAAGNQDPFSECPTCRVCDGAGSCQPAADGSDPKNECQAAECLLDSCRAGSCAAPAGSACADGNTLDCWSAACDGQGTCDQAHAPEQAGHACDDSDACTAPDACDDVGTCLGTPLAPEPDAASSVAATTSCLTVGTGATAVVYVDLTDAAGQPLSGASVNIEADEPALTWAGPVAESLARPGTYYRLLQAPASAPAGNDTVVSVMAQTFSGSCQSRLVTMNTTVTITFAPATAGTAGGCALDDNLRVRVLEAGSGVPLAGAYVMVGDAQATVFEPDFDAVLAGTASVPNTGQTDAQGYLEFTDHGTALQGPLMVTAGLDGYGYTSYADSDAADLVLYLEPITTPPASATIEGQVTGLPVVTKDGWMDAGMVMNQLGLDSVVRFRFDDLLAQQAECWLAASAPLVGDQWVEMPSNIYVPQQVEHYWIFDITVNEHRYTTVPLEIGAADQHIVALAGQVPWDDVINLLLNGGSLAGIVPLLDIQRIGLIQRATISGDETNVAIDAAIGLNANAACLLSDKHPSLAGSDDMCLALGDWAGGQGSGPMFIMGFGQLSGGSGTVTTVADNGPYAGIGYLGFGVSAYLDSGSLPPGEEWKASATSGVLDRSGNLGPGGGSLNFSQLLGITPLSVSGAAAYAWNDVSYSNSTVDLTQHDLELWDTATYSIGANCNDITVVTGRSVLWRVYAPGGTTSFTLPQLPAGWPRAADGGLASPGADQLLHWSFAAYHLGLLAGGFDFDAGDITTLLDWVTHTSTNGLDLP